MVAARHAAIDASWRRALPAAATQFRGAVTEAGFPAAYWLVEYPDNMDVDVDEEIYPWGVITSVAKRTYIRC